MTAYRKFRKWNTGIKLFPVLPIVKKKNFFYINADRPTLDFFWQVTVNTHFFFGHINIVYYLPANAKIGRNVPRQWRRWVSSSVTGLYHNNRRWDKILDETTLPDNISLDIPSAAMVRNSESCNKSYTKYHGENSVTKP